MEKNDINGFRTLLTKKNVELTSKLTKPDDAAPDAKLNPEPESKTLREVRTALTRIEYGSYGICLNCDEEISPIRLRALPWTSLCFACQELDDRARSGRFTQPEFRQASAA
jgi:RNA polymerase-binding transcription factor DksA